MTQRTDMLLLAQGEYSDYQNKLFKVLKPFTLRQASEEFLAQWVLPEKGYPKEPQPEQFEAWLHAAGYVEDLPVHEPHLGSYGLFGIEGEVLDVQFAPGSAP